MSGGLFSTHLFLTLGAYVVAVASPGPSNLAIMGIAMQLGRRAAFGFALGVVTGSLFWAVLAALGLSAVLATYSQALLLIKILGGLYLLWLGAKSARAALRHEQVLQSFPHERASLSLRRLYARGLGLHLTNPKAILTWLSIVSFGLPHNALLGDALVLIALCASLGMIVFCGYAIAFSTAAARRVYGATRRWLEATLALVFGLAGVKLLLSRN